MWTPPNISDLPDWSKFDQVAIDTETYNPNIKKMGSAAYRDGYLVGVSFAVRTCSGNEGYYLPLRHQGGGNVDLDQAIRYLKAQMGYEGEIVGANLKYDMAFLGREGIKFPFSTLRDIQVADPLINELQTSYALQTIAERWGFPGKAESILDLAAKEFGLSAKADLYQLNSQYVGEYATRDATLPLEIYQRQCAELTRQDLWPIFDLESAVTPVIIDMEERGVRIDLERLGEVKQQLYLAELATLESIFKATGVVIPSEDIWKTKALLPLFKCLEIELPLTPTGKPSVKEEVLTGIDHPAVHELVHARKLNKLRTTFCESIARFTSPDGRIHCQFNQIKNEFGGAAFGRMSCSKPNLQQIPKRTAEGSLIRGIFIPDEGCDWVSLDFSSQEPRILFHYAYLLGIPGVREIVEQLRRDPNFDIHSHTAAQMGTTRDHAKTIFLGLCYGSGAGQLAKQLGLPYTTTSKQGKQYRVAGDEATLILNEFHRAAPYIGLLSESCQRRASKRGYIRTLLGRKCRFPRGLGGEYDFIYRALNRLCQGSAADQTKKAMIDAYAAGIPLQLQIHDELTLSAPASGADRAPASGADRAPALSSDSIKKLQDIMISAVKLEVPTICSVTRSSRWGQK